jgi:hypothetical protein
LEGGRVSEENKKYFSLATKVAKEILQSRDRALDWWHEEKPHRERHGITQEQEKTLLGILAKRFPKDNAA